MNKLKIVLNKQLSLGVVLASVLFLSTIIGFGIHLVFAWTGPTANPPLGVPPPYPPITTAGGQTISGNLTLSGDLLKTGADGQLAVSLDKVFRDTGDSYLRLRTAAGGSTYADFAANNMYAAGDLTVAGGDISFLSGSGARIGSGGSGSMHVFQNTADDGSYEWFGWYSGASRAGIFLWDGGWNGCDAGKFCVFGDTHQLMLASNTGNVLVNDNLDVAGVVNVNNNRITNVATPTAASDAATKAYVDALAQGATAFRYAEGNTAPCPTVSGLTLRGVYYWDGLQNRPGAGTDCAARQTCICFYSSL
ncbi:MAG: hypothetical protein A2V69_02025 [Candidatus Portnoybacteria bacterium RBG_13_40_8]|uniref:Uncharacterized protein n=1 Tax=Candidatus Portnoybacteria bacterium RBG_13_40_8 TaxID=1801990 RepID=A0A1G2F379_9BACT|nr:MAG: hypothetical protein A2V69_02025 [Candidatus Portnoybacteria bacterium RBG_13_40_8]